MNAERAQPPITPIAPVASGALAEQLLGSLKALWRNYRKELKRCQKHFSETAVHDLRVRTRRLLSELDLLSAVLSGDDLDQARRELKRRLDSFDDLRDTQVQLRLAGKALGVFPELKPFREELARRESRLVKRLSGKISHSKVTRLAKDINALKRQVKKLSAGSGSDPELVLALTRAINRAHARAVVLRRRIDPADTATIHRTRVAFKKFRYMAESMKHALPGLKRKQLKAMREYQAIMGDIQDIEVLQARLDKLVAKQKIRNQDLRRFRTDLRQRRAALVREYLGLADRLFTFWEPRGSASNRKP